MGRGFLDVAVTPAVRDAQRRRGAARTWEDFGGRREDDRFTDREVAFITGRDSFYMATTSETGWPYVQHRGGPAGFLKVLDDRTLAFADYRGNLQFVTVGNLSANDKACLFLMDYPRRRRLKVYAQAEVMDLDSDAMLTRAVLQDVTAEVVGIVRLTLKSFDWNCSRHITPRRTEREIAEAPRRLPKAP